MNEITKIILLLMPLFLTLFLSGLGIYLLIRAKKIILKINNLDSFDKVAILDCLLDKKSTMFLIGSFFVFMMATIIFIAGLFLIKPIGELNLGELKI